MTTEKKYFVSYDGAPIDWDELASFKQVFVQIAEGLSLKSFGEARIFEVKQIGVTISGLDSE